jgi:hypothetical protein
MKLQGVQTLEVAKKGDEVAIPEIPPVSSRLLTDLSGVMKYNNLLELHVMLHYWSKSASRFRLSMMSLTSLNTSLNSRGRI